MVRVINLPLTTLFSFCSHFTHGTVCNGGCHDSILDSIAIFFKWADTAKPHVRVHRGRNTPQLGCYSSRHIYFCECCVLRSALLADVAQYESIFTPFHHANPKNWILAEGILTSLSVTVVDVTLLFRMLAAYPYETTRKTRFFAIFTPTLLFKLARIALLLAWVYMPMDTDPSSPLNFPMLSKTQVRLGSASFVLTTVDNM